MKMQVAKIRDREEFTIIYDSEADSNNKYSLYYHTWRQNKNGVYTKRRYLVDKVVSIDMCLAWIMDILNDEKNLQDALSKELRKGA